MFAIQLPQRWPTGRGLMRSRCPGHYQMMPAPLQFAVRAAAHARFNESLGVPQALLTEEELSWDSEYS